MEILARSIFLPVVQAIAFLLLFSTPMLLLGLWLRRERKLEKAALLEPFTDLPLRPPGESLRKKIDELTEKIDEHVVGMVLTGAVSSGLVLGVPAENKLLIGVTLLIINAISAFVIAPKLKRLVRELRDYRLGFKGERVVGEDLNRLMADRYAVYHDVPFKNFNIDHVIVGPAGVFAVETKTRSKRSDAQWEKKATATFDGQSITFNGYVDTESVKQARLNAIDLAKFLSVATGEPTSAVAILTVPGWYVADAPAVDNLVARNPSRIRPFILEMPDCISQSQLTRIRHQLNRRCGWAEQAIDAGA